MDPMDIAYMGFMAEEEGLLDTRRGKLNAIANDLNRVPGEAGYDDLREICIRHGVRELSAEEMQYIGSKVK